jgi:ketosteroid isomerase-like protein
MRYRVVVAIFVLQFAAGRVEAQRGAQDSSAVRAAIAAAWAQLGQRLVAKDSVGLTQLMTREVVTVFNTETVGNAAVQSYWSGVFRTLTWEQFDYTIDHFAVHGPLVYDFGVYTDRFRNAAGTVTTRRLRSSSIWQRQSDGSWKLHRWFVTVARLPG